MTPALRRFRLLAWVVSVVLVVFILVAVPLNHLGGRPWLSHTISPVHGFLYAVYLVFTIMLGRERRWTFWRTLGVMLAGTVPVVSFLVERRVTRELA